MSEPDTKARVVSKSHHTMSLTTTLHTFLGRKVIRITTMPLFGSTPFFCQNGSESFRICIGTGRLVECILR